MATFKFNRSGYNTSFVATLTEDEFVDRNLVKTLKEEHKEKKIKELKFIYSECLKMEGVKPITEKQIVKPKKNKKGGK